MGWFVCSEDQCCHQQDESQKEINLSFICNHECLCMIKLWLVMDSSSCHDDQWSWKWSKSTSCSYISEWPPEFLPVIYPLKEFVSRKWINVVSSLCQIVVAREVLIHLLTGLSFYPNSMFKAFLRAGLPLIKIISFFRSFFIFCFLLAVLLFYCAIILLLESKTFSCILLLAEFSSAIFQLFYLSAYPIQGIS